jgi:glutamate/tyrosine decarboxylase-like PLP-dependent enzyme
VIGNAGATNTGAIDDLVEISRICKQYDIWFHVDGAYGAPAARSDLTRDLFAGLASANSVALDPHKWLYVPVECGCALIRGRDDLKSTFELVPDYLRQMSTDSEETGRKDWYTRTFQTTRDAKALRVWATFLAYGADGLLSEIENNIRTMRELGEKISQSSDFELLAPVVLSTICFRYISDAKEVQADENELNSINRELIAAIETDGRVFVPGTRVHGKIALRACTVNHRNRREHADRMLNSIRELAQSIVAQRRVGGHR